MDKQGVASSVGDQQSLRTTVKFSLTDKVHWSRGPFFLGLFFFFSFSFNFHCVWLQVGALDEVLVEVKKHGISLHRIESRPSFENGCDYDFFVEFIAPADEAEKLTKAVQPIVKNVMVVSSSKSGTLLKEMNE